MTNPSSKQKLIRILGVPGWSRDRLADLLGVSNNSLNAWLSGNSQPRPTHAARIDEVYDELVKPLLCEIETLADEVEKRLLSERIERLPEDNVCKTD